MAIHEFECRRCGMEFEFIKVRSDEVAECPKCEAKGEEYLEKKFPTQVTHILEGTGWARDGYSSKRKRK